MIFSLHAQTNVVQDTTKAVSEKPLRERKPRNAVKRQPSDSVSFMMGDTITYVGDSVVFIDVKKGKEFKPESKKAVIYSAIFPGLGQIYNRKYWKLPIVYGGFVGLSYAITWNGRTYNDYAQGYKDLVTGTGDSWKDLIRGSQANNLSESEKTRLISTLKRRRDYFRRNRDLAIICTVGLYALCMIDAYVDAELYDFDVSPDLSMRIAPVMFEPTLHTGRAFGLQCSINF